MNLNRNGFSMEYIDGILPLKWMLRYFIDFRNSGGNKIENKEKYNIISNYYHYFMYP